MFDRHIMLQPYAWKGLPITIGVQSNLGQHKKQGEGKYGYNSVARLFNGNYDVMHSTLTYMVN